MRLDWDDPDADSEDTDDLGGGFELLKSADRERIIVATALADTGALGFASPVSVDARLDADALAWAARAGMLRGRRLCSLSQIHSATCTSANAGSALTKVAPTHCPACGAPLDQGLTQCQYCGTALPSFELTNLENTDAVWTRSSDDLLIIRTADCAAVWLVDPEHAHLAMMHAGWRGVAGGIVQQTVDTLRAQGGDPGFMVASIGPHIGPCCFEVGPEVAEQFRDIDGAVGPASLLTAPRQRDDSLSLNLGCVLVSKLRDAGISQTAINLSTACTRCFRSGDGEPLFHSYRRNGKGGPLMASIGFLER